MPRVQVNNTSISLTYEATQGVLATAPVWFLMEPNQGGITAFGATTRQVERNPISRNRQRRKGGIVGVDAAFEWEGDLILEHFYRVAEAFVFSSFRYPHAGGADQPEIRSGTNSGTTAFGNNLAAAADPPPVGTDSGFTHDALANAVDTGTLIYVRGFDTAINNGIHHVITGSTTTATLIETTTLVNETPGDTANASLEICGRRGASGDLTWTQATRTLGSTALDFTTLGLTVGQALHAGGVSSATQFAGGTLVGRIDSIAANAIVLSKIQGTLTADDNGAGVTVDILFGRFLRNVPTDSGEFLERYIRAEMALPDLEAIGTPRFKYVVGGGANTLSLNVPLEDKATMSMGFVATDSQPATVTRELNGDNPLEPRQTAALTTADDIARLRLHELDETGLTTCIKDATFNLTNDVTNEFCIGSAAANNTNQGNFGLTVDLQIQFTDADVEAAVRNNETVGLDALLRNDDGGIYIDAPSGTLSGGDFELPENASVLMNLTFTAFQDEALGTSVGISTFPVLPATAA